MAIAGTVILILALASYPPPTLYGPANGSGTNNSPVLWWSSVPGATKYRVQISHNSSFTDLHANVLVSGTTLQTLESDGTYYWRVRVRNNPYEPAGAWSATWSFTASGGPPPPPGVTYHVDCAASGSGNGSSSNPWNMSQAKAANLTSGQSIGLKRGTSCNYGSNWTINWNGVTITNYGSGSLPKFINTNRSASQTIDVVGDNNVIDGLEVIGPDTDFATADLNCTTCGLAGIKFESGSTGNTLKNSAISGNYAGVFLKNDANNNKITSNHIFKNDLLKTSGPDNGAFGILLWGSSNVIAHNSFNDNNAYSPDYQPGDGSSVEVYTADGNSAASNNVIHHNKTVNDNAFTELGKGSSAQTPTNNVYYYNSYVATTANPAIGNALFIVTRGTTGDGYGPINGVKAYNNSIYIAAGSNKAAVVCVGSCSASSLIYRNNILISSGGAASVNGAAGSNNITSGSPYKSPPNDLGLVSNNNGGVNDSNISAYDLDLAGRTVSIPRDIGAYEF